MICILVPSSFPPPPAPASSNLYMSVPSFFDLVVKTECLAFLSWIQSVQVFIDSFVDHRCFEEEGQG